MSPDTSYRAALARLRRALSTTDVEAARAGPAENLIALAMETLAPDQLLLLERRLTALAETAEELGPDAAPEAVVEAARARERRQS